MCETGRITPIPRQEKPEVGRSWHRRYPVAPLQHVEKQHHSGNRQRRHAFVRLRERNFVGSANSGPNRPGAPFERVRTQSENDRLIAFPIPDDGRSV